MSLIIIAGIGSLELMNSDKPNLNDLHALCIEWMHATCNFFLGFRCKLLVFDFACAYEAFHDICC